MGKNSFAQKWYQQSVTQKEELGTIMMLNDGRVFAYARAGAVALAAGKLTQNSVVDTNAHNEALSATQSAAIGAKSVIMTFGGAVAASYYKDGYLHVNDATGEGHIYGVKDHAAGTADVVINLKDPIRVALVASTSDLTLTKHPQDLVIVYPTSGTGIPVGISPIVVDINYYFWNQVKGPAVCLTDGTIVIGQHVRVSDGVAGAVEALDRDGTAEDEAAVGTVLQVNATTDYSLIMLAIPGY